MWLGGGGQGEAFDPHVDSVCVGVEALDTAVGSMWGDVRPLTQLSEVCVWGTRPLTQLTIVCGGTRGL